MHKAVKRTLTVLFVMVVAVIVFNLALSSGLSYYDSKARERLMLEIARELPPHPTTAEMSEFMRLHTTRFALNKEPRHEYVGFAPQTKFDRVLFDRKIQIVLALDESGSFRNAEIYIYYTGL